MALTAIIVDDEELARDYLRELLARHVDIEIVAQCSNGFDAVKEASARRPDLLFLDIQMPKLDGFEVLDLIEPGIAVIFVVAHTHIDITLTLARTRARTRTRTLTLTLTPHHVAASRSFALTCRLFRMRTSVRVLI